MPSTRINRAVTLNEAADALREQLGSQYRVSLQPSGSRETIRVGRPGVAFCNVQIVRDGSSTMFRVHGEACCSAVSLMNSSSSGRFALRSRI